MGSEPWWQQPSKPPAEPFFTDAADARWLVLEAFAVMLLLPTATFVFTTRAWSDHQALWAGVVLSVAFLLNTVSRRERDHRDRIFTSQDGT